MIGCDHMNRGILVYLYRNIQPQNLAYLDLFNYNKILL